MPGGSGAPAARRPPKPTAPDRCFAAARLGLGGLEPVVGLDSEIPTSFATCFNKASPVRATATTSSRNSRGYRLGVVNLLPSEANPTDQVPTKAWPAPSAADPVKGCPRRQGLRIQAARTQVDLRPQKQNGPGRKSGQHRVFSERVGGVLRTTAFGPGCPRSPDDRYPCGRWGKHSTTRWGRTAVVG